MCWVLWSGFFTPLVKDVPKHNVNAGMHRQVEFLSVVEARKALCYLPHEDMWYQLEDTTLEHQGHATIQYRDGVYISSRQTKSCAWTVTDSGVLHAFQ